MATRQHDAFSIGLTTTDDFQNADVLYEDTLPAIKAALTRPPGAPKAIPIVTGFLGRGINTGMGTVILTHIQHAAAAREVLGTALCTIVCLSLSVLWWQSCPPSGKSSPAGGRGTVASCSFAMCLLQYQGHEH